MSAGTNRLFFFQVQFSGTFQGVQDKRGADILDTGDGGELIIDKGCIAWHIPHRYFQHKVHIARELVTFKYFVKDNQPLFYLLQRRDLVEASSRFPAGYLIFLHHFYQEPYCFTSIFQLFSPNFL